MTCLVEFACGLDRGRLRNVVKSSLGLLVSIEANDEVLVLVELMLEGSVAK